MLDHSGIDCWRFFWRYNGNNNRWTSDSYNRFSETTNVLTNASQANCSLNSSTGAITTTDFGGKQQHQQHTIYKLQ